MPGCVHSPSASHTELLPPPLHRKPSPQTNTATLPYVVPVSDSRIASFTGAGGPQSTTERGAGIQEHINEITEPHRLVLNIHKTREKHNQGIVLCGSMLITLDLDHNEVAWPNLTFARLPLQEVFSLCGWKGSFPLWTLYPSWHVHSKLPGMFVH